MKSALVVTRSIAARTSASMAMCWAFISTSGRCFSATRFFCTPYVGPLVEAFEANQLVDALESQSWAAGHHRSCLDVLGDHAAGTDERTSADAQAGQDGRVGADAHVILDCGAEHAFEVAGADRVRIVGEDDMRAKEDPVTQGRVLEEAAAVNPRPIADSIARLQHGIGADAAVVTDDVVLADQCAMAAVEAISDDRPRIDDRARADHPSRTDHRLKLA